LPTLDLSELEAEIEQTRAYKKKCLDYLETELQLALASVGNDVKVLRLLKGIEERYAEARLLASRLRREASSGLAGAASSGPQNFDNLMAAKRTPKERSAS
jgi:hypothetical protein